MRFWLCATRAVFAKEMRLSLRAKPAWATMALFSLVTIFILGFSTTGASQNSQLLAGFYWVTMFYATTIGLQGTFTDEATAGTLLALRMYGHSEAIFFGKTTYAYVLLLILSLINLLLFTFFFNAFNLLSLAFILLLCLSLWSMALAALMVSAMMAFAEGLPGLFVALLLPLVLPCLLLSIAGTESILTTATLRFDVAIALCLYDGALTAAASLLFEELWQA